MDIISKLKIKIEGIFFLKIYKINNVKIKSIIIGSASRAIETNVKINKNVLITSFFIFVTKMSRCSFDKSSNSFGMEKNSRIYDLW